MSKLFFLTIVKLFFLANFVFAQNNETKPIVNNTAENSNNLMQAAGGGVLQTFRQVNLAGDVYLDAEWRNATLVLKDGSAKTVAKARYNANNNEVEVLFPNDSVLAVNESINEFRLDKSEKKDEQIFRSGFAAYNGNTKKTFYEVIYDGKMKVLVRYHKVVQRDNTEGDYRTGAKTDRLVLKKDYYITDEKGKLSEFDNAKKAFLEKFADKKKSIEDFVKQNKLNYREHADMKKIMEFIEK